jgi:hypothetical protein
MLNDWNSKNLLFATNKIAVFSLLDEKRLWVRWAKKQNEFANFDVGCNFFGN